MNNLMSFFDALLAVNYEITMFLGNLIEYDCFANFLIIRLLMPLFFLEHNIDMSLWD